jgi:hypothetical protein
MRSERKKKNQGREREREREAEKEFLTFARNQFLLGRGDLRGTLGH